jgi:hypothetical protein
MEKKNIIFAEGFNFKRKENCPDWVIGSLGVNKEQAIKWLASQKGDWVNMDIAQSKSNNFYVALNTWKPSNQSNPSSNQSSNIPQFKPQPNASDDLPF